MGGKDTSRGILCQAMASVLEALCQNNWDKIYLEFESYQDKVDIALERNKKIFKSIQVKSTVNTFDKNSIQKWLQDLIQDDVGAIEFELFLIGQCEKEARVFINSINKFQCQKLDKTAETSLKGFNTEIIKGKKIEFRNILFDIKALESILRDSLFAYVSNNGKRMTLKQISFIASAMINDQLISSITSEGVDRESFNTELQRRIDLLFDKQASLDKTLIGIKSFDIQPGNPNTEIHWLSLLDMFEGRYLKAEYEWNKDISERLKEFLYANTDTDSEYGIYLDTHLSIAFASGRILNSKSGINILPFQKSAVGGTQLWDIQQDSEESYPNWNVENEVLNENAFDTVLILKVTRDIYSDVIRFICENNLAVRRIITCSLSTGSTNFSIKNGYHASYLANSVYRALSQRSKSERLATLHIFSSAPNAFMFFLGQNSKGFGKCVLYEYDFEQQRSCSYLPSINFNQD